MDQKTISADKFWQTIETAASQAKGNLDEFTRLMDKELSNWSYSELYHFQIIYEAYELATVRHPNNLIWSALMVINNGYCSSTYGFAGWLIAQGKDAFLKTMQNPDHLATLDAH